VECTQEEPLLRVGSVVVPCNGSRGKATVSIVYPFGGLKFPLSYAICLDRFHLDTGPSISRNSNRQAGKLSILMAVGTATELEAENHKGSAFEPRGIARATEPEKSQEPCVEEPGFG